MGLRSPKNQNVVLFHKWRDFSSLAQLNRVFPSKAIGRDFLCQKKPEKIFGFRKKNLGGEKNKKRKKPGWEKNKKGKKSEKARNKTQAPEGCGIKLDETAPKKNVKAAASEHLWWWGGHWIPGRGQASKVVPGWAGEWTGVGPSHCWCLGTERSGAEVVAKLGDETVPGAREWANPPVGVVAAGQVGRVSS